MRTILFALALWPSIAFAGNTPPVRMDDTGITLSVIWDDGTKTDLVEGAGLQARSYKATGAELLADGLSAGTHYGVVFRDANAASVTAADWSVATIGPVVFDGADVVLAQNAVWLVPAASPTANTFGEQFSILGGSIGSNTTGISSIITTLGSPVESIAGDIADIDAGGTIPVNQVPIPPSRTFDLIPKSSGLVGNKAKGLAVGDSQPFAWDFAKDLPTNGRLVSVDSVTIVDGTTGGLTFANSDNDPGVDKTLGKVTINAVTADTYTVRMTATYQDGEGGGTRSGDVEIVVTE